MKDYRELSLEERTKSRMTPSERRAAENEMEGSRSAQKALGRKMVKKMRQERRPER